MISFNTVIKHHNMKEDCIVVNINRFQKELITVQTSDACEYLRNSNSVSVVYDGEFVKETFGVELGKIIPYNGYRFFIGEARDASYKWVICDPSTQKEGNYLLSFGGYRTIIAASYFAYKTIDRIIMNKKADELEANPHKTDLQEFFDWLSV